MQEAKIKNILQKAKKHISDPDLIIDPYDLTFVWVSDNFCNITRYSKSEIIGEQFFKISTRRPDEAKQIEMEIIKTDSVKQIKLPIKTKDGTEMIVLGKSCNIYFDGQPFMAGNILKRL